MQTSADVCRRLQFCRLEGGLEASSGRTGGTVDVDVDVDVVDVVCGSCSQKED